MQLKGLVRFFAVLLTIICLYQLSFTFFVRSHESEMQKKAETWVKRNFVSPEERYPSATDAALKAVYADSLKLVTENRLQVLLDSTKSSKIGWFGFTTYRNAKDKELALGLDLQGGMSVTMEVSMDGLIKSLADYPKDANFNKALESAVAKKANTGADLISLFVEEYKSLGSSNNLANFFINKSNGKIKFSSNNNDVVSYLRDKSVEAFKNTTNIIRNRIDKFGVASPNINPDEQKGTINIELAGAKDPERVRNFLQSTANLQFFECYRVIDIADNIRAADKSLEDYLVGTKTNTDSTKKDTTTTAKVDSSKLNPLLRLVQFVQPYDDKGVQKWPSNLGYVLIKDTATVNQYLALETVKTKFPPNAKFVYGKLERDRDDKDLNFLSLYAIKTLDNDQAELEGDHITGARPDYGQSGEVVVSMEMDAVGTNIWGKMTERNIGKPIAIVLDNTVYSAPNIISAIKEGRSQITGSFSVQDATDLSQILESGTLPAPAKIVHQYIIGPTLGAEAVKGGALSFAIAFGVIFILMLLYYNTAGWIANIALILNLLFTVGVLASLGFTLTAAGIAGLVLTIGMAVDTNVIIFERIKEELIRGKKYDVAVNEGYKRSLAPVLDAHVTVFLTAAILFIFGLGPILGFATTQMLGITLSLFCGILVSRLITDMYADEKKDRRFQYFTAVSKRIFKHASYKFIEYRKYAYGLSFVVLAFGIASLFNGFDQGVEFAGGRSYTIKFDTKIDPDALREDLKTTFAGEMPIVKTIGTDGKKLNITTAYKIKEAGLKVDAEVEQTLFNGLSGKYLPENTTFAKFSTYHKESSQTVLPSISSDLKRGAVKAGIIAIFLICFYIFIRFRDWRYSLGTIVALLHDICVTLAVFSFCREFVSFPLEIDQHFIAALLTVIGFSMNDTVIVYDRIREDSRLYPTMPKEQVINTAINQTLSRTIMTSLTVFLTILILFLFGGEVTKGFSFAMLVGVITGTYSSIFVAAPILVDFAKSKPLGKVEKKK
ncbi:MAG: protein translocase subunit SecDF [Chitinophagaceae bacterium]|nr:protein translocase subunit SecDF [Chitinophagaceae bacterium]